MKKVKSLQEKVALIVELEILVSEYEAKYRANGYVVGKDYVLFLRALRKLQNIRDSL